MGRAAQLRNRYPRSRFHITDKLSSLTAPIMLRILSAVLRRSILVERRKVLAGALRIECVELSRTELYGD